MIGVLFAAGDSLNEWVIQVKIHMKIPICGFQLFEKGVF